MRLEEDKPAGIEHTAQVSYNTAAKRVRCVPVPATGTVIAGTGTEFPTRGLPVPNPNQYFIFFSLIGNGTLMGPPDLEFA